MINYPGARLIPNTKFENGDPDIDFFDNARGQWKPARAWFGTLVENVVQGSARDLLAAALLRFEARGLPVVFHCHDEVVIEVPEGSITEAEVLAILLEPPPGPRACRSAAKCIPVRSISQRRRRASLPRRSRRSST